MPPPPTDSRGASSAASLWLRAAILALVASAATQLVVVAAQLRSIGLGRVAVGWPLPALYHVADFRIEGDIILRSESRFEIAGWGLVADLAVFAGAYLVLLVVLRLAWVATRPAPQPLQG